MFFHPELERSGKRHSYPVETGNNYADLCPNIRRRLLRINRLPAKTAIQKKSILHRLNFRIKN